MNETYTNKKQITVIFRYLKIHAVASEVAEMSPVLNIRK